MRAHILCFSCSRSLFCVSGGRRVCGLSVVLARPRRSVPWLKPGTNAVHVGGFALLSRPKALGCCLILTLFPPSHTDSNFFKRTFLKIPEKYILYVCLLQFNTYKYHVKSPILKRKLLLVHRFQIVSQSSGYDISDTTVFFLH